jgi:hypothetical protein
MADDTFEIYSYDGTSFNKTSHTKSIYSTWYNKNDKSEYIGFTDGVVDANYDEDAYYSLYESEM